MKKQSLKNLLLSGCSIEYKKISICYLPDYYDNLIHRPGYQIHCENRKLKDGYYSNIHFSLDEAIDKFMGIKKFIYG